MAAAGAGNTQNMEFFRANYAATNNTMALQMAMAQGMMQQQQQQLVQSQMGNFNPMDQARMFAQQQQQNQMALLTNAANNGFNMPGQQAATGQNPEDQRLLGAMFLDHFNKQQKQQQQNQQASTNTSQQQQHQQQQHNQQAHPNAAQQQQQQQQQNQQQGLGSMSTIASLTPSMMSNPSAGLSNFDFGTHQATSVAAVGNNSRQQGINSNNASLQFMSSTQASHTSLKTLVGDGAGTNSGPPVGHPQLSYPNGGGVGRGRRADNSFTGNTMGGYLHQNSKVAEGGGCGRGNSDGGFGNQGNVKKEQNTTETFC